MKKNGYLNLSEFAKLMGVTRQAISYAVKRGKIKTKMLGKTRMVHGVRATKEWEKNIDPKASAKGRKPKNKKSLTEKQIENAPEFKPKTYEGFTMADAERQDKVYKARLSQLKYLEQAGQLVKIDKIQRQAFETGRKIRDALMGLPTRLAHELAVETDPHKLEIRLTKELTDVLDRIIGEKNDKG